MLNQFFCPININDGFIWLIAVISALARWLYLLYTKTANGFSNRKVTLSRREGWEGSDEKASGWISFPSSVFQLQIIANFFSISCPLIVLCVCFTVCPQDPIMISCIPFFPASMNFATTSWKSINKANGCFQSRLLCFRLHIRGRRCLSTDKSPSNIHCDTTKT